MDDVTELLERQAAWQKARKSLPWPEKIRIAEAVRDSIQLIRSTGPGLKILERTLKLPAKLITPAEVK